MVAPPIGPRQVGNAGHSATFLASCNAANSAVSIPRSSLKNVVVVLRPFLMAEAEAGATALAHRGIRST